MKALVVSAVAVAVILSACETPVIQPSPSPSVTPSPSLSPSVSPSPQAFTSLGNMVTFEDNGVRVAEAQALGVKYARTSQNLNAGNRALVDMYKKVGISVVIHVKAGTDTAVADLSTPEKVAAYKKSLGDVLDALKPAYLCVENEENWVDFYPGTPEQYIVELKAAVEVAHAKGIKVTDGGITSGTITILTWQDYIDRGLRSEADDYAKRVFIGPRSWILKDVSDGKFDSTNHPDLLASVAKSKALITYFKDIAIDYANFHWYEPDAKALKETTAYISRAEGHEPVSSEMGEEGAPGALGTPSVVTGLLDAAVTDLRMPFLIWYDHDGALEGKTFAALAIHEANTSPIVLRDTGKAFRAWVDAHQSVLK